MTLVDFVDGVAALTLLGALLGLMFMLSTRKISSTPR